jgi:C1A family cysteine protease
MNSILFAAMLIPLPAFESYKATVERFDAITEAYAPIVDFRSLDTPIRDQGQEGLCTAFAVNAALEQGTKLNLSERHLWSLYRKYDMTAALVAAKRGVTTEAIWPYYSSAPVQPIRIAAAVRSYRTLRNMTELLGALKRQAPVVLAADVTAKWQEPPNGYIKLGGSVIGGHAIKISGVFKGTYHNYFFIKNSWGTDYGDRGWAYLPIEYCQTYWCSFMEVAK